MDLLDQVKQLIRTATTSDIGKINEVLVSLIILYSDYDLMTAEQELGYEKLRAETYIETKKKKKLGESQMTDGDINHHSKLTALKGFGDYKISKAKKNEYKEWIDMLKGKKIEVFTTEKNSI